MLVYRELRRRNRDGLYTVRSWYLFGFLLVFRRWEQLTTRFVTATQSEIEDGPA